jgi:hypothetical protein
MPTIDEELAQMERDIRQLKIEYDMFFGGGRKRPPTEIEWRIELLVKRYGERGGDMKFGQRMAKREEGKIDRHFGAAAKAIEAERARTPPPAAVPAPSKEAAPPPPTALPAGAGSKTFRMAFSEPEKEEQKVEQLFHAFVEAKKQAGEATEKVTRAGFNEFVRKKTKDLQTKKNCRDVEYVVETVDGQVKLKALVKS